MLSCEVSSHFRSGVAKLVGATPETSLLPKTAEPEDEKMGSDRKLPISWLPVMPHPTRSLRSLMASTPCRKLSSERRQPTVTAGKMPHFSFSPKRDEPSRRIDAETM